MCSRPCPRTQSRPRPPGHRETDDGLRPPCGRAGTGGTIGEEFPQAVTCWFIPRGLSSGFGVGYFLCVADRRSSTQGHLRSRVQASGPLEEGTSPSRAERSASSWCVSPMREAPHSRERLGATDRARAPWSPPAAQRSPEGLELGEEHHPMSRYVPRRSGTAAVGRSPAHRRHRGQQCATSPSSTHHHALVAELATRSEGCRGYGSLGSPPSWGIPAPPAGGAYGRWAPSSVAIPGSGLFTSRYKTGYAKQFLGVEVL